MYNESDYSDFFLLFLVAIIITGTVFVILAFSGVFDTPLYAGDSRSQAAEISNAAIANNCNAEVAQNLVRHEGVHDQFSGHPAWRFDYTKRIKTFVWYSNYTKKDYSVVLGC